MVVSYTFGKSNIQTCETDVQCKYGGEYILLHTQVLLSI